MTTEFSPPVTPNPDQVLGVEVVEKPYDPNTPSRWEDPRIAGIPEPEDAPLDANDLG